MKAFTRVLYPTDLSEASLAAAPYASAIARWYEGRLTVLHVVPTLEPQIFVGGGGAPATVVPPVPIDDVRRAMHAAVPADLVAGLDVGFEVRDGAPAAAIAAFARQDGATLIVMGTHGRSGFDRLIGGSITEKVLRRAPCPVLTIPPHAAARPAGASFSRVLCAVDFSPASERAMALGLDLARQSQGTAAVAHVIEWLPDEEIRAHAHYNVAEYRAHVQDEAQQRLHALLGDESRAWCEIDEVVRVGRAHRELLRLAAERDCDLIAVGAQGHGALGQAIFGSTTPQVVRGASCPVLVVSETADVG
ncbi:MAG: universal stress protein [Vicinamibacterales bacterium]